MNIVDTFNLLINRLNLIMCNIANMQQYIGIASDESTGTLTGRIYQLEQNSSGDSDCECRLVIEWDTESISCPTEEW